MDFLTLAVFALMLYILNAWLPWPANLKHGINAVAFVLLLLYLLLRVVVVLPRN